MQSQKAAAKVICNTNLDKDLLGWKDGEFFIVNALSRRWRVVTIPKESDRFTDCDFQMVTQKVREFLQGYQGELRLHVNEQLTILESKTPKLASKTPTLLQQIDAFSNPIHPKTPLSKPSKVRSLERPNFRELLRKFAQQTESQAKAYYLPYLPIDARCCRCNWIYCPAKTVVLPPKESGEYIHANTVSLGEGLDFIATIYPFKNRAWFWQMVQMKGNLIVDVTNKNDLSTRSIKPYYPTVENETISYEEMEVTCLETKQINETIFLYTLSVKNLQTGEEKTVDRMHYIGWEDVMGTNERELLELIEAMKPYLNQAAVPIVHCMGGVGRTGTALAGVALEQLHRQGLLNNDNRLEHMGNLLIEGRKQRGPEFLQTDTQIETLWSLINLLQE